MNIVHIAGHLGADPEVRFTSNGNKVTTMRLAARVRRGANNDETIWWRVTIWGEQFDKMIPYLKKGTPLFVIGDLSKPEIFNDREGNPQISMNVTAVNLQFSPFGRVKDAQQQEQQESTPQSENVPQSFSEQSLAGHPQAGMGQDDSSSFSQDDEVPF